MKETWKKLTNMYGARVTESKANDELKMKPCGSVTAEK